MRLLRLARSHELRSSEGKRADARAAQFDHTKSASTTLKLRAPQARENAARKQHAPSNPPRSVLRENNFKWLALGVLHLPLALELARSERGCRDTRRKSDGGKRGCYLCYIPQTTTLSICIAAWRPSEAIGNTSDSLSSVAVFNRRPRRRALLLTGGLVDFE
jgi:hypothetical protein